MIENYEIIRSNRKTIAIQIHPDGRITVRCPMKMKMADIRSFVESKSAWIYKHTASLQSCNVSKLTAEEIDQLRVCTGKLVRERAAYYAPILGVTYNKISVRAQKSRWGSCSSKNNLSFNCLLAMSPSYVLDYVVVHELCHLKQMNHSAAFWAEVKSVLPDYENAKSWLKVNGNALIYRIEG